MEVTGQLGCPFIPQEPGVMYIDWGQDLSLTWSLLLRLAGWSMSSPRGLSAAELMEGAGPRCAPETHLSPPLHCWGFGAHITPWCATLFHMDLGLTPMSSCVHSKKFSDCAISPVLNLKRTSFKQRTCGKIHLHPRCPCFPLKLPLHFTFSFHHQ